MRKCLILVVKMNVYLQDKPWKGNESNIHDFWAYVDSDISSPSIDLGIWHKGKDYVSLSAHRDYLLIDVRIKANQAGRHHPYHPPICPSPIQPPLCSCLKAWAPNLPSWQTLKHATMIEGHSLSLALPLNPLSSSIHPQTSAIANWVQLQCCILVFNINLQLERGSAGCRLTNFALNTNTDCFGRRLCVAIPYVPTGYTVTYLLYFSRFHRQAPPVLLYSPPPPRPQAMICHSFVIVSKSGQMQTSRI